MLVFMMLCGVGPIDAEAGNGNASTPEHPTPDSLGSVASEAPDHVLVKFSRPTTHGQIQAIYARHHLRERSEIPGIQVKVVGISELDTPDEVIQRVKFFHARAIEFAEIDALMPPSQVPNDPFFTSQQDKYQIGAPAAWDSTTGLETITIGIADSGVDCTHEDLAGNCVAGWNFYDNNSDASDVHGHGTAVAGVSAAIGNNGLGVAGAVWRSKIMPLRISDPSGWAYWSTVANAITFAADRGVKAVNNSYQSGGSSTIRSAARYLKQKGGLLVVSEGNSGSNTGYDNSPDLISVSAVDGNGALYSWSSFGNDVDVAAPGCTGATTARGGGYRSFCGTSNSAPETAGVLMLLWSVNPTFSPDQVQSFLFNSAVDLGTSGWDQFFGWGRIDAARAVAAALNAGGPDTTPPTAPTNLTATAPDSSRVALSWTASTDDIGVSGYRVYRDGAHVGTSFSTSYSDTTVVEGTTYLYAVQAYDAAGNASLLSNTATVTVPYPPFSITSYAVSYKTASTATVRWTTNQPSTGSVAYGTSATGLNLSVADSTVGTAHTVVLTNLKPKTVYYYRITATSNDGASQASTKISNFRTKPR